MSKVVTTIRVWRDRDGTYGATWNDGATWGHASPPEALEALDWSWFGERFESRTPREVLVWTRVESEFEQWLKDYQESCGAYSCDPVVMTEKIRHLLEVANQAEYPET